MGNFGKKINIQKNWEKSNSVEPELEIVTEHSLVPLPFQSIQFSRHFLFNGYLTDLLS